MSKNIKMCLYLIILSTVIILSGCFGDEMQGIAEARLASTVVKHDFLHRPLPEIPLPNDLATRYDETSATKKRLNASLLAPSTFEETTRYLINQLDGWGIYQAITIPFTGPLNVESIINGHRDPDFDQSNDVVYLINIDRNSTEFGTLHYVDIGNGNFPLTLEERDLYWPNDPRGESLSLLFEETEEDLNGNGVLDPGEDTDSDGVLDHPNYLPGHNPAKDDLAARADALMTFYEKETNTLILRPMVPLKERTTYAVVVTRRLLDQDGDPVGSPFPWINHGTQNKALEPLEEVLPEGLRLDDVAFAFSYTTQSIQSHMAAVRDGLYGHGVQAHLGENFPAEIDQFDQLYDTKKFPLQKNPYILYEEQFHDTFEKIATQVRGWDTNAVHGSLALQSRQYIDFQAVGTYISPQLFNRFDEAENWIGLSEQSWPPDLDLTPAIARGEDVPLWIVVPRKEVSVRSEGKPAPTVIMGHGYGSSFIEVFWLGSYLAKHGIATIGINCPSHGLSMTKTEENIAKTFVKQDGFEQILHAILKSRAFDQNQDGIGDSGADMWTAYAFHTRDMVRQCALDYMQLVRILRSYDGKRQWKQDLNGDGTNELAGDFDGDGNVDIGGSATIGMFGGSLGGIMSMVMGGIEPGISTVIPVSGGGGLADIGNRSTQSGVPESFLLRVMSSLFIGNLDNDGILTIETILPDLRDARFLPIGTFEDTQNGDTIVVKNKDTNESGCGVVDAKGKVRFSVGTSVGHSLVIEQYRGRVIIGPDCEIQKDTNPIATIDKFEKDFSFQSQQIEGNSSLIALVEGMGRRRSSPELRRANTFTGFIIEPGDPIVYMSQYFRSPYTYATGETTGAHVAIVTTGGDMSVVPNSGIAAGRAAGLIDFLKPDPLHGKSINQVLIDTHFTEGVHNLKRYTNSKGEGVHMDVENFSQGTDHWGSEIPRLDSPLHKSTVQNDSLGGVSASIFPLGEEQESHGFDEPGGMLDGVRGKCKEECSFGEEGDPCGCNKIESFDIGLFMFNMLGHYFATDGKELSFDLCNSRNDCDYLKPAPKPRELKSLP